MLIVVTATSAVTALELAREGPQALYSSCAPAPPFMVTWIAPSWKAINELDTPPLILKVVQQCTVFPQLLEDFVPRYFASGHHWGGIHPPELLSWPLAFFKNFWICPVGGTAIGLSGGGGVPPRFIRLERPLHICQYMNKFWNWSISAEW